MNKFLLYPKKNITMTISPKNNCSIKNKNIKHDILNLYDTNINSHFLNYVIFFLILSLIIHFIKFY